jgi:hypothetical protein
MIYRPTQSPELLIIPLSSCNLVFAVTIHDCNRRAVGAPTSGLHNVIYSNWRSRKAEAAAATNHQRTPTDATEHRQPCQPAIVPQFIFKRFDKKNEI